MSPLEYNNLTAIIDVYFFYASLSFLVLSFFLAYKIPNIRWLIGSAVFLKSIGVVWSLNVDKNSLGLSYYIYASLFDILIATVILMRQKACLGLVQLHENYSNFATRSLYSIAKPACQNYRLTGAEILVVCAYGISIMFNGLSVAEELFRRSFEYKPLFIWYSYAPVKYTTWIISVSAMLTLALHAYRGDIETMYRKG